MVLFGYTTTGYTITLVCNYPACVICLVQYLSVRMFWGWKHSCVLGERWSAGWCVGMCVSGGPAVLPLSGEGPRLAGRENNTEPSAGQKSPPWLCWGGNGFNYTSADAYLRPTRWHCERDGFSTSRTEELRLSVYSWNRVEVWVLFSVALSWDFMKHLTTHLSSAIQLS